MKSLAIDHLPLIASAPDGVKKLRELILQLAVMGKLVPQDPNDEPASELLRRIQLERANKTGNSDRSNKSPKSTDGEFVLPRLWAWAKLNDLCEDVQYGYTASADHSSLTVRMLRITDIQNDKVDWTKVPGCAIEPEKQGAYSLRNGDILIARTGGTIGKSYLVEGLNCESVFASYLIRIKKLDESFPQYIKLFLGSRTYWTQLRARSMGTGQPNVNGTALKSLLIPLPPLAEQHRIVAKVDELMALCDKLEAQQTDSEAAHSLLVKTLLDTLTQSQDADDFAASWVRIKENFHTLFTTEESVDILKQTLLQLAVMGKLVPQDPNDEPASELVAKLRLLDSAVAKKQFRQTDNGSLSRSKEPDEDVPIGWCCELLGIVVDLVSGQHLKPDEYSHVNAGDMIPYLTGPAEFGIRNPSPTRYTSERRALAVKGDVLLTVKGAGVGKTNVVDLPELAISRQLMAVRARTFLNRYLELFLQSIANEFQDDSVGIAIPGISREDVQSKWICLPPLAEQHRIVAKVDELMALCDKLKAGIQASRRLRDQVGHVMLCNAVDGARIAKADQTNRTVLLGA